MKYISKKPRLNRRHFLKCSMGGAGVLMGLPFLEAMLAPSIGRSIASSQAPLRFLAVSYPHGYYDTDQYFANGTGQLDALSYILNDLSSLKEHLLVLDNLKNPINDTRPGPDQHARSGVSLLTCTLGVPNVQLVGGISIDQRLATLIEQNADLEGREEQFALKKFLNLGCAGRVNHYDGIFQAYQDRISWASETQPANFFSSPKQAFDSLFAGIDSEGVDQARITKLELRKSWIDFVKGDLDRLKRELGSGDRIKLDEYLTSVRELEVEIDDSISSEQGPPLPNWDAEDYQTEASYSDVNDFERYLDAQFSILKFALQIDRTRVATFMMQPDRTERRYPFIDVDDSFHYITHQSDVRVGTINRFHTKKFGEFLQSMKNIQEGDGTLLDNTLTFYGSGMGDPNVHNFNRLPILLAGDAKGKLKQGQQITLPSETPLSNLYLTILREIFGFQGESTFADSTGTLEEILA